MTARPGLWRFPSVLLHAKCKFCAGRLRLDFEREEKAGGFSYYRCEEGDLPNIFSAQSAQPPSLIDNQVVPNTKRVPTAEWTTLSPSACRAKS